MNYYVYLAKLDDIPRYIGFGSNGREFHVNSGVSHVRKLNEVVLKEEREFEIEILFDGLSKYEAAKKEIECILQYGRADLQTGTLWNQTSGGIGTLNYKHTEETKKKIKAASFDRWHSLNSRERIIAKKKFLKNGERTRFKGRKVNIFGITYNTVKEAQKKLKKPYKFIIENESKL